MANTFKNYTQKAVGTSPVTLYTVGAGVQSTVIGMTISNVIATTISVSVGIGTSPTVWLVKDATIAPGGSFVPIGGEQKLVLEATDTLVANTSVASSADVIVSVLEVN